jgi:hypothetical protein
MATPEPKSEPDLEEQLADMALVIDGEPVKVTEVSKPYAQPMLGDGFFGLWGDEAIVRGEE